MVNLNRQIRATQARQGGFSAHVLPGAVGYQPVPSWLFPPRKVDDNWVVDFNAGGALQFADGEQTYGSWIPTWALETAAAPYSGAGWLKSTISGTRQLGDPFGGGRFISQVDARFAPANNASFTMEWWAQTSVSGNGALSSLVVRIRPSGLSHNPFRMRLASKGGAFYAFDASFSLAGATAPDGFGSLGHDTLSAADVAQWAHYAAVVDPPSDEVRLYINGQRVSDTYNSSFSTAGFNTYSWAGVNEVNIEHAVEAPIGAFSANAGVSGLRFTPSVLYTSNFTPPQL